MSDVNNVVILGRLVEKPIVKYGGSGIAVTNLRIANNIYMKNAENNTKTNYFTVVVFGKQAENCEKYLDKGRQVAINGRLDHNTWENKEGQKRSTVQIVANMVQFIGSKPNANSDEVPQNPEQESVQEPSGPIPTQNPGESSVDNNAPQPTNDFNSTFESPIDDVDDIPF